MSDKLEHVPSTYAVMCGKDASGFIRPFLVDADGKVVTNSLNLTGVKSGATQVASGAVANEVWKTASHATLPDNVLMIGV